MLGLAEVFLFCQGVHPLLDPGILTIVFCWFNSLIPLDSHAFVQMIAEANTILFFVACCCSEGGLLVPNIFCTAYNATHLGLRCKLHGGFYFIMGSNSHSYTYSDMTTLEALWPAMPRIQHYLPCSLLMRGMLIAEVFCLASLQLLQFCAGYSNIFHTVTSIISISMRAWLTNLHALAMSLTAEVLVRETNLHKQQYLQQRNVLNSAATIMEHRTNEQLALPICFFLLLPTPILICQKDEQVGQKNLISIKKSNHKSKPKKTNSFNAKNFG